MNKVGKKKVKTIFNYEKLLKQATDNVMQNLENMFKKKWEEDDETLNNAEQDIIYSNEDENDFFID